MTKVHVVPAKALGHAHIWCDGLTQVWPGDSRIGNLCDFYCDTSALAEVSTCWRKLTGHWVGSGIVVSIKGGGAHRNAWLRAMMSACGDWLKATAPRKCGSTAFSAMPR